MNNREFNDAVFGHFARVGAALGNAKRVEMVAVLAQGERSVDELARQVGASVGNTSRNLQVLASAGLVTKRVEGTSRIYRLSHPSVLAAYRSLVKVSEERIADVSALTSSFFNEFDDAKPMQLDDLERAVEEEEELTLIDVRPVDEYLAGHVTGAISIPLSDMAERMDELPLDTPIVAYCRGPYCVMAAHAVKQLREAGFSATRLEPGYPEWRMNQDSNPQTPQKNL